MDFRSKNQPMKRFLRHSGLTGAVLGLSIAVSPASHAQESLAGVGAASGISSSMSGFSNSATMEAGRRARGSAAGFGSRGSMDMGDEFGSGGSGGGMPSPEMGGMGGMGGSGGFGGAAAAPAPPKPRTYGLQKGDALLGELLAGQRAMPKIPSPVGRSRSPRAQAELSRRLRAMTAAQRKKFVMQKYDIRPRNWLAHYLKADRYKMTSGLWGFLTTRTSRFYYRPWSAAMLKADPNHVIGFRTWQDAMLAGYRPDPVSRPEPAPQLVQMASYTKGPGMQRYIEFVYAGQVSPTVFTRNYQYVTQVATVLQNYKRRYPSTPSYTGETVEKVLLASMGEGAVPTSIGGPPPPPPSLNGGMSGEFSSGSSGSGSGMMMSGSGSSSGSSSMMSSGSSEPPGSGKREESFNNFSSRAGSLANVPANSSGPPTN